MIYFKSLRWNGQYLKSKYKVHFLLVFCCLQVPYIFAQNQAFEDYAQKIGGSSLNIEMIAIPSGTFKMGSDDEIASDDEKPAHQVIIDQFYMSKYEVTWDLYNLFLNRIADDGSTPKGEDVNLQVDAVAGATIPYVDMSLGMGTGEDLPVGNVTQFAASKFCEWLSAKTGYFYRLPTEAEWEYAARAGSTTAYFFGDNEDELNAYAWFYNNSENTYHKIGQKKPNTWGLYDMYGNVSEWTLDQYVPEIYKQRGNSTKNPLEKAILKYSGAVRGGSYYDYPEDLRSAARKPSSEKWKMRDPQFPKSKWWNTDAPFVGFRIVRQVNPPVNEDFAYYWIK